MSGIPERTSGGRPLWAEIDLDAVADNFQALRAMVGPDVRIYACLKGNGYGCGVEAVGLRLAAEGAEAFAVGNIDDALHLRAAGISQPILLYPTCLPDALELVTGHDLTITISSIEEAEAWAAVATQPLDAFIKLDVGAFRAGVAPHEAVALGRRMRELNCFRLAGIYGHLNLPDPASMEPYAAWQFARFRDSVAAMQADGTELPVRMVSGTAAVMHYPEMDLNAVDPGRILYGIGFAGTRRQPDLKPALKALKARLILCKSLAEEDMGGYAPPFAVRPGMRLGIIPLGWGDGFPRPLPEGALALVRGKRVPLVGPTHFEHLRIDLTDVPEATLGDEVVLIGSQGDETLPVAEVAQRWGLTALELVGTLRAHIHRRYSGLPSSRKETAA